MKCIVTAGPTYEELDEVRRLTNFSTGKLGVGLADYLAVRGHEVVLLLGYYATVQCVANRRTCVRFTTTADLQAQLPALADPACHVVYHAAAVSDFCFGRICQQQANGELVPIQARKIPTRAGSIWAELIPTPKIIHRLREWFPNAYVVGWKYEADGDRSTVLTLAQRQMEENCTQACVVNGPAYGEGFGLVQPGSPCLNLADAEALYQVLERSPQAANHAAEQKQ